jgi:predicted TIM-barrel fold metal-dependent hydrolase
MCAHAFWGSEHLLFGADMPLGDRQLGYGSYKKTIRAIDHMDISDKEKTNIFRDNAKRLMRLPI